MPRPCNNCANEAHYRRCTKEWLCHPCRELDEFRLITRTKALNKYGFKTDQLIGAYKAKKIQMFTIPNSKGKYPARLYYDRELLALAEYLFGPEDTKQRIKEWQENDNNITQVIKIVDE